MTRLRISAISFLNTVPLMWDFEHGTAGADFDISYTIPSSCAEALRSGTADIGIIPAAAYAVMPDLVSKVPIDQIRTVGLDSSSMTSVALAKILFAKWLGGPRIYTSVAPDLDL